MQTASLPEAQGWGGDDMGGMRTHVVLWETVGGDTKIFLWLGYLTSTLPSRSDLRGLRAGRQPEAVPTLKKVKIEGKEDSQGNFV